MFWMKTADFISDRSSLILHQKMVKGLPETGSSDVILVAPRVFGKVQLRDVKRFGNKQRWTKRLRRNRSRRAIILENDDVDVEVVLSLVQPYEDEPLADAASEPDLEEENKDADVDGLYTNWFRGQIWKNDSSYLLVGIAISKWFEWHLSLLSMYIFEKLVFNVHVLYLAFSGANVSDATRRI